MKRLTVVLFMLAAGICTATTVSAQKFPERRIIRQGNKLFENKEYEQAETSYLRALELNPGSFEAGFNLANSFYKQQRYEEAAKSFGQLAEQAPGPSYAAHAFYNLGNSLFQQRKLEEAIEAYKNSLRINPTDQEAKFNLAYAQKLLEKKDDQDNGGGGSDNQDNQNDKNNNPNNDPGKGDQQKEEKQQPPPSSSMSRQDADQLLDAVQAIEDNTKEKMDERKVQGVGKSGKNW